MRFLLGFFIGMAVGFGLTTYMAGQQHMQHHDHHA
jgi:hypothetical protein